MWMKKLRPNRRNLKSGHQVLFLMSSICRRRCSSRIILRKCMLDSKLKTSTHILRSKRCRLLTTTILFNISTPLKSMGLQSKARKRNCMKKLCKSKRKFRFQLRKNYLRKLKKRVKIWKISNPYHKVLKSLLFAQAQISCQHPTKSETNLIHQRGRR